MCNDVFLFYKLVTYCAKVDGHFTSTRSSTAEVIWNYEIENVIKLNFKTVMLLEYAHRGPRRRLCDFFQIRFRINTKRYHAMACRRAPEVSSCRLVFFKKEFHAEMLSSILWKSRCQTYT